jgi:hypothetical protein
MSSSTTTVQSLKTLEIHYFSSLMPLPLFPPAPARPCRLLPRHSSKTRSSRSSETETGCWQENPHKWSSPTTTSPSNYKTRHPLCSRRNSRNHKHNSLKQTKTIHQTGLLATIDSLFPFSVNFAKIFIHPQPLHNR